MDPSVDETPVESTDPFVSSLDTENIDDQLREKEKEFMDSKLNIPSYTIVPS